MLIRKQADWLTADVGDQIALMSIEKGLYVALNGMGTRIWSLLDKPQTASQLCEQLQQEFDVSPESCRTEVETFLAELTRHGAIMREPTGDT